MTADAAALATDAAMSAMFYGRDIAGFAKSVKTGGATAAKAFSKALVKASPVGAVLAIGDVAYLAGEGIDVAANNTDKDFSNVGENVVSAGLNGLSEHYKHTDTTADKIRQDAFNAAREATSGIPFFSDVASVAITGAETVADTFDAAQGFAGNTVVEVVDGLTHLSDATGEALGIAEGVRNEENNPEVVYANEYVSANVGEAFDGGLSSFLGYGIGAMFGGNTVANDLFSSDELQSLRDGLETVPEHALYTPIAEAENVYSADGNFVDGTWLELLDRGQITEDELSIINGMDETGKIDALLYYCAGASMEQTLEHAQAGTLPHDEILCPLVNNRNAEIDKEMYGEVDENGVFHVYEEGIRLDKGLFYGEGEDFAYVEYDETEDAYYTLDGEHNRIEQVNAEDIYEEYVYINLEGELTVGRSNQEEALEEEFGSNHVFDTYFIKEAKKLVENPVHELLAPIPSTKNILDTRGDYVMACWESLADDGSISEETLEEIKGLAPQTQTEALIYYCSGASEQDTMSCLASDTLLTDVDITKTLESLRDQSSSFGMVNEQGEYVLWEDGVHYGEGLYSSNGYQVQYNEENDTFYEISEDGGLSEPISDDEVFAGYITYNENGEAEITSYLQEEIDGINRIYGDESEEQLNELGQENSSENVLNDYFDDKLDKMAEKVEKSLAVVGAITGIDELKNLGKAAGDMLEDLGNQFEEIITKDNGLDETENQSETSVEEAFEV